MNFIKKHKIVSLIVILILIGSVAFFALRGSNEGNFETQIVEITVVEQFVEETGTVESYEEADLSLEQSGRVISIPVSRGEDVEAGDILIELDDSEQRANLLSAQAQLKAEQANLDDLLVNASGSSQSGSSLSATEKQQKTLIENSYSKLLSEGLVVEPSRSNYTQTAPTISGRYSGLEGRYKIVIDRGSQVNDYELSVFDLETIRDVEISQTGLTPLGTGGLFVSFSDTLGSYVGTTWYLTIPNTESSSYLANYNAYIAAKEGADVTVINTSNTEQKIAAQEARVDQALAAVKTAEANLAKRTLRAPFTGTVSNIGISVGETSAASSVVISLISNNNYEVLVEIPESDIAYVSVGDTADITFDAYDDDVFTARVTYISPGANVIDGVSTFETRLQFDNPDELIKSGLSADVNILTEKRTNVMAVLSRAIVERADGERFVRVVENNDIFERTVTTGLRGTNGMVEITSGLNVGDEVITFITDETLSKLTD